MEWFEEKNPEKLACSVSSFGEALWEQDAYRRAEVEQTMRRFNARTLRGLFQGREIQVDKNNLRLNVTKSVTETLCSKVGKNRPRPLVLTDGGNWSLRKRAKRLQKFLDGAYHQAKVYTKTPLVFRDALLCGTGAMYFYADVGRKQVCAERVFPLELLVDHVGATDGVPQDLVRIKFLSKARVKAMRPKLARKIDQLQLAEGTDLPNYVDNEPVQTDMVKVFEAWHLATYDYEGGFVPGRHVVASGDVLIADEPWEHDYFPFEFNHWTPPMRGFWGDSAVAEIRGLEKEANSLLQQAQKAMRLCGSPWVLVPTTAEVPEDVLTNEVAQVIPYEGDKPPIIQTFQPIDPMILQQVWVLVAKCYEMLGTNENQAAARKPPGDVSGKALELLAEDHLVRFDNVSSAFEDTVGSGYARQFIRVAKELDERIEGGFQLRAMANKTTLKIKWSDAALSPDDFFLQCWPTSILPITPSGRTSEVERWQQNQWIKPEQAQRLLEFPDLDAFNDVRRADDDLLEWQIEQMLDEGASIVPDEIQDLQKALQWGTYALEKSLTDDTPEENRNMLRDFLQATREMLGPPPAPAPTTTNAGMVPQTPAVPPGPGLMPAMPPGMPPQVPGTPGM